MGFFKTLFTGYKLIFEDINTKHNDLIPRMFSGTGTGLMMIGSAVMAKTALQEDTQQIISDCDKAIEEARKAQEGDTKVTKTKRIFKAKVVKGLKVAKAFRKGIIMEAVGGACVGTGLHISEEGKHKAIKAAGAMGAAFAAYRGAVREDLGEEADLKYLTGRKAVKRTDKVNKKTGEITQELAYVEDDGSVVIKKNPNSFRLLYSKETTPSVWSENHDLRIAMLRDVQDLLTRKLRYSGTKTTRGHISLNDMRREFGGLRPSTMDVDEGGIFGRVLLDDIPITEQRVNLHYQDDEDFMMGRKDWCWLIFDCDPQPIIGRITKRFKQVEN